ncbi:MAG TPA: FAD-linked oxidase, partial [Anaeromyxobacter sp.]|nr:FAD-linked oxidase [Anaeromyxobacter sp.]
MRREGRAAALEALARAFPPDRLVMDAEKREAYGRDESELGAHPPDAVVLVESADEVRTLFAIATRHGVPV